MKSLKILVVGNSFADDTMTFAPDIALALGVKSIRFAYLYMGGCSINMHYENATGDLPSYNYYTSTGDGWHIERGYKSSDAIRSDDWDYIAIQHGTKDGSRYSSAESYEKLTPLINYIKALAPQAKIVFNLTWVGEPTRNHHEILSYGGDVATMRRNIEKVTAQVILGNPPVDILTPTGTAIENARTSSRIGILTRDGFHLSLDKGRYIAALTFIGKITGLPLDGITWTPEGVDEYCRLVAIESAKNAIKSPLEITRSAL